MAQDTVYEKLNLVQDAASFIEFLQALQNDWYRSVANEKMSPSNPYASNHLGWENSNIVRQDLRVIAEGTKSKLRVMPH